MWHIATIVAIHETQNMPLCSLLVDSSWLLLVCHEMWKYQWVYFAVKFDEVSEVEPYFMATDIQTTVNNHAIKAV